MNSAFGVDHGGYPPLKDEMKSVSKSMVVGLARVGREAAKTAVTPKKVRMQRHYQRGQQARKTDDAARQAGFPGTSIESRPRAFYNRKGREAWDRGFNG